MENKDCKHCCNSCGFLLKRKTNYSDHNYNNVYCEKDERTKLIELSIKEGEDIKTPYWCPLLENAKIEEKIKEGQTLTMGEKRTILMQHKPFIAWDDIKVQQIYHIPPLLGEKRKDILVTWKGDYSCTFKDLSKNYNAIETIYPSTLMSRFFVEHKLKKVAVAEQK